MGKKLVTRLTEQVLTDAPTGVEETGKVDKRGKHPASLANLSKKGMTNNPSGKPATPIKDALRKLMKSKKPGDPLKRTYAEIIAQAAIDKAEAGDMSAFREINDRSEGKVSQEVEMTGNTPVITAIHLDI
jgi:hypothetical protein